MGHVGQLPAPCSAEFVPFGSCSFLLCCWQPGKYSPEFSLWSWPKLGLAWRIPQEVSAQWVKDELGITFRCPTTGCITCFAILLFVGLFAEPVSL